jgi:hypothetical protein
LFAIVEIFNRPIEEQPRGICDMGCGDGYRAQFPPSELATVTLNFFTAPQYTA